MPSKPKPKPKIDGSWIINDTEDGEISWAEDTDPSDLDDQPHTLKTPPLPKQKATSHNRTPKTRSTIDKESPKFIMPLAREQPAPPKAAMRRPVPQAQASRPVRQNSSTANAQPTIVYRKTEASAGSKVLEMLFIIGGYLLDVMITALKTLKRPISWVLAAYAFVGLLVLFQNLLTSSIYSALSPICRIPGVSLLHLPICQSPYASTNQPTISASSASSNSADPEFDALMTVQGKFETILEDSAAGVSLPLDMKRSETSIRDLRQVIRFSSIPSKNELLHEFDGFIETARIASYDLQKFNSHVGRAVDSVLSTARWTQRVLDDISFQTSQSSGLISDFINNRLLAPFQPLQFTESRLLDQYITHTRLISGEIEALIDEAQALLLVLTNIEDRLDIIHGISLRDNMAAQSSRDEILAQLWTVVGGNRAKLGKVDNQLRLLARVGEYRKLAYAHVSGTILKLQAMGAELEELRTRVGSAELAHDRGVKGIPLSMHIENIRLGVERLEGQREMAREVEKGHVRRIMDKASGKEEMMLVEG